MNPNHTRKLFAFAAGLAGALALTVPAAQAQNLLVNPDFENGMTGWTTFGHASSASTFTQSGSFALKEYGNWWSTWDATGAYQNLPANPGDSFTLTAYGFDSSADAVSGANQNYALLKIVWLDGGGNALQPLAGPGAVTGSSPGIESQHLNNQTPLDTWVPLSASGVAPAGTASIQIFGGLFVQPNWEGGSLWFDNESLTVASVPEPSSLALLGLGAVSAFLWRRRN